MSIFMIKSAIMGRIYILYISILLLFITGCSAIALPKLTTPKKPETIYNWNETSRTTPKAVITNGKVVVVEETERILSIGLEQTPRKLSFAQKIGNWISSLSIIGVILLIAGLILAPGATLGFLVKTLFKWKKAFRETVIAIKEAKAIDEDPDLKNALKDKQSLETKKLVDDIKRSI